MERLTRRDRNGTAYKWDLCRSEDEVIEKLAAYEDAEEEGRLIILPCAPGDTVYEVLRGWSKDYPSRIVEFVMDEEKYIFSNRNYFGDFLFTTRDEAEAKLKELEADNG